MSMFLKFQRSSRVTTRLLRKANGSPRLSYFLRVPTTHQFSPFVMRWSSFRELAALRVNGEAFFHRPISEIVVF